MHLSLVLPGSLAIYFSLANTQHASFLHLHTHALKCPCNAIVQEKNFSWRLVGFVFFFFFFKDQGNCSNGSRRAGGHDLRSSAGNWILGKLVKCFNGLCSWPAAKTERSKCDAVMLSEPHRGWMLMMGKGYSPLAKMMWQWAGRHVVDSHCPSVVLIVGVGVRSCKWNKREDEATARERECAEGCTWRIKRGKRGSWFNWAQCASGLEERERGVTGDW